jgi:hypothetical protein
MSTYTFPHVYVHGRPASDPAASTLCRRRRIPLLHLMQPVRCHHSVCVAMGLSSPTPMTNSLAGCAAIAPSRTDRFGDQTDDRIVEVA